jgi:methyl-accepting chemotaxis protein
MSGKVIQINLKANVDEALSKISGASSQIASSLKGVQTAQNNLSESVNNNIAPLTEAEQKQSKLAETSTKASSVIKQQTTDYKGLVVGISGVATASVFSLYF